MDKKPKHHDQDADTKTVMELGSPVSLGLLLEVANHMKPPEKPGGA